MNKALTIALREVRSYLQDKADLAFSLLLPVAIFAVMYGAFGGQTEFRGAVNVVNEDSGQYSTDLLNRLDAMDNLNVQVISAIAADSKLDRSNVLLVTFIPDDFSARITKGQPAEVLIKQRGNGGTEGQIVASIVRGVVEEMNGEFEVRRQVGSLLKDRGIAESDIDATVDKYVEKERQSPLVKVTEKTVGTSPDPVNQFLPGIITMFVLFSLSISAQTIVEERRKGTLERLMTTRLTRDELFLGKFLSGLLRGFVQAVILLGLSYIVFGLFTPLSFLEVLVVAAAFSAAASALGLVIAILSRSPDQAIWISVVFTNVAVILAGTFFDIPEGSFFAVLSKFSPNTYVNNALVGIISEGKPLSNFGGDIAVILGVAIVGLVLSRILFRPVPGGR